MKIAIPAESTNSGPVEKGNCLVYSISVAWLVFGTLVGQYVSTKFICPEMDSVSWLSFGKLRPVHTNTVFWGWASLAMIGLDSFISSCIWIQVYINPSSNGKQYPFPEAV